MNSFDPNDYRKRVLAVVEKRGGPETSDPFELYDLPVEHDVDDAVVAQRVAEVWGAWQRQRDHPKYRVLVALLVAGHDTRSAELLDAGRRRTAAVRVRAQREQRDSARYELLDAAASRLVARHRGLPRDKIEGLHEVGTLAGLTRDEVRARLRRHRVVDGTPGIGTERRRQVRSLLDELGRLTDTPAPPTLLALLELAPAASEPQVRARAGAWRTRARELPPARLRSVLDELLVHVAELLEPGRVAVDRYLDAVAADVTELLRPRVRAAVLVEDRLVAEDHAHLVEEAGALGLDDTRARAVLAVLAAELGAPIESPSGPATAPPDRGWEAALRAARAALRAGRPVQAGRLVREVGDGGAPVRAMAAEIDAVLAAADRRRRAATAALTTRRHAEAVEHLEHLHRTAADVPDPRGGDLDEQLAAARAALRQADDAVAAALAGPEPDRPAALAAVLDACPGHLGATAALATIPLAPPGPVRAARDGRGDVVVVWDPSPTAGVGYKVSRLQPGGAWQVVGRVGDISIIDGGAPPTARPPVYAVVATAAGRTSTPTRSDEQARPEGRARPEDQARSDQARSDQARSDQAPPDRPVAPTPPQDVRAERTSPDTVAVRWTGPGGAEFRVRCRMPDGCWRVVGRTRGAGISDGGAPAGEVAEYSVSAAVGGARSAETSSRA